MTTRAAQDDIVYRRRLREGSLVGVDPPVDECVKRLVRFQAALLSTSTSDGGGSGSGGGVGDTAGDGGSSNNSNAGNACERFCEALDRLDFHVRQTRHAGRIAEAETASLRALQADIRQYQNTAREEIAALKIDLKAAYQTHLNKEEYEVRDYCLSLGC